MSQYPGRRAPNVSQYLANLNSVPSNQDAPAQPDFPNFEDDLAMFTNTQFFDFDMNENVPDMQGDINYDQRRAQQAKGLQYVNQQPHFPYNEFSQYPNQQPPQVLHVSPVHSLPASPPNGLPGSYQAQQSQPTIPTAAAFSSLQPTVMAGDKRTPAQASLSNTQDLEDVSRFAAEEDKRRRNTAASARFRVKKKQREAALEKTAKEMSEKVQVLEARVGQLEMENKWLKGLITEKNIKSDDDSSPIEVTKKESKGKEAKVDASVAAANGKKKEEMKESAERSTDEKTDGVGTEAEAVKA